MSTPLAHEIYIPGYVPQKVLMILFGVLLLGLGFPDLAASLKLLIFGIPGSAQAVRVVKVRTGLPDAVFLDDVQLRKNVEGRDRSYLFWNVFAFQTSTGKSLEVRMPTPGLLKPLYSINDTDGLPTTLPIRYDPTNAETVLFPTVFSTWIFPSLLTLIGLLGIGCGSVLLYWARRPIEMPIVPPDTGPSTTQGKH